MFIISKDSIVGCRDTNFLQMLIENVPTSIIMIEKCGFFNDGGLNW